MLVGDIGRLPRQPPERRYTQYDEELGWVNTPNVHLRDMYGPGVWLRTNAQGHRAEASFTREVPAGRVRVICSGDSFTFGFGVSNAEAWCERLGAKDPRIEPVNMGQAGYGLGQAYLWYRRDGAAFEHDIHIFAFIWDDFDRLVRSDLNGYAKPVFAVRNGQLVVENVPVPRRSYLVPAVTSWLLRSRRVLSDLRITELARRVRSGVTDEAARSANRAKATWIVAEKVFDSLMAHHHTRGSALVLIHLPAPGDDEYTPARRWEAELLAYAERTGVAYVDLGDDLQRMAPDSASLMFGDHSHYTPAGNDWVAGRLLDHFRRIPQVRERLEDPARPSGHSSAAGS